VRLGGELGAVRGSPSHKEKKAMARRRRRQTKAWIPPAQKLTLKSKYWTKKRKVEEFPKEREGGIISRKKLNLHRPPGSETAKGAGQKIDPREERVNSPTRDHLKKKGEKNQMSEGCAGSNGRKGSHFRTGPRWWSIALHRAVDC